MKNLHIIFTTTIITNYLTEKIYEQQNFLPKFQQNQENKAHAKNTMPENKQKEKLFTTSCS